MIGEAVRKQTLKMPGKLKNRIKTVGLHFSREIHVCKRSGKGQDWGWSYHGTLFHYDSALQSVSLCLVQYRDIDCLALLVPVVNGELSG